MSVSKNIYLGSYILALCKVVDVEDSSIVCASDSDHQVSGDFCSVCGSKVITKVVHNPTYRRYHHMLGIEIDDSFVDDMLVVGYDSATDCFIPNTFQLNLNDLDVDYIDLTHLEVIKEIAKFKELNELYISEVLDVVYTSYEIKYGVVVWYN